MARLEKILYYPIKSLGGQEVDFCNIKNNRIVYDRIFSFKFSNKSMQNDNLWQSKNNFLTLSNTPMLTHFKSTWDPIKRNLSIYRNEMNIITINLNDERARIENLITDLVSAFELNPFNNNSQRKPLILVGDGCNFYQDNVSGYVTLHNNASKRDIEKKLGEDISNKRFRSNLIIDGLYEWEEFNFIGNKIRIGECEFYAKKNIPRCIAINANPINGLTDINLLKSLVDINSMPEPSFGISLEHLGVGDVLNVGDSVELV